MPCSPALSRRRKLLAPRTSQAAQMHARTHARMCRLLRERADDAEAREASAMGTAPPPASRCSPRRAAPPAASRLLACLGSELAVARIQACRAAPQPGFTLGCMQPDHLRSEMIKSVGVWGRGTKGRAHARTHTPHARTHTHTHILTHTHTQTLTHSHTQARASGSAQACIAATPWPTCSGSKSSQHPTACNQFVGSGPWPAPNCSARRSCLSPAASQHPTARPAAAVALACLLLPHDPKRCCGAAARTRTTRPRARASAPRRAKPTEPGRRGGARKRQRTARGESRRAGLRGATRAIAMTRRMWAGEVPKRAQVCLCLRQQARHT